jgi:hypothetical protein
MFNTVLMSRKKCQKCGREFLILDGKTMTETEYDRVENRQPKRNVSG